MSLARTSATQGVHEPGSWTQGRAGRWSLILDQLATRQTLSVAGAAKLLGVSRATIRRDFRALADRQLATRHHGGIAAASIAYEVPHRHRGSAADGDQARMAAVAASLVQGARFIALNGGTTTTATARAITAVEREPGEGQLTLVTNALNVAMAVMLRPRVRCISLGGVARPESYEIGGTLALTALAQLWFDATIFGVDGLTPAEGATCAHDAEALVVGTMLERSRSSICVADGRKIGARAMTSICPASRLTHLVTTPAADPATVAGLRSAGVTVHFA